MSFAAFFFGKLFIIHFMISKWKSSDFNWLRFQSFPFKFRFRFRLRLRSKIYWNELCIYLIQLLTEKRCCNELSKVFEKREISKRIQSSQFMSQAMSLSLILPCQRYCSTIIRNAQRIRKKNFIRKKTGSPFFSSNKDWLLSEEHW